MPDIHTMNCGSQAKIIEIYRKGKEGGISGCKIEFLDYPCVIDANLYDVRRGLVTNPMKPSIFGVGFPGIGEYLTWDNAAKKGTKAYKTWYSMIARCYRPDNRDGAYKDCTVASVWHNFQQFAEWFSKQKRLDGWQLDKDVLSKEGSKIYSPLTCCFIPAQINALVTTTSLNSTGVVVKNGKFCARLSISGKNVNLGRFATLNEAKAVYNLAKKNYIRSVAFTWKDLVDAKVYDRLLGLADSF